MPDVFVSTTKNLLLNSHSGLVHALTAYCKNPTGISFKDQDDDEEIILFLRHHFITNVPWIFIGIIFLLIPLILSFFSFSIHNSLTFIPQNFINVFIVFYYLIVINYIFVKFITWFYNISLITQKRIVDIDFSDLVYRNVAETTLDLIQDVDYTQTGVIRSIIDYGDVFVQTASEKPNFDFLASPKPAAVTNIISSLIGKGENHV